MVVGGKNSLDLLRLIAAILVLYSHQYALGGLPEPSFFGWNSFGGAGVTIFFFLSGMLVWSSWERDSNWRRFFIRRALRIFPALWVVVLGSVFLLGPFFSALPLSAYFADTQTWRYLSTALLVTRNVLPGVFADNPFPYAVNGSLWTLPVEFLCYVSIALVGSVKLISRSVLLGIALVLVTLLATYASLVTGVRFSPHFEMLAVFWFGVFYGYCLAPSRKGLESPQLTIMLVVLGLSIFFFLGPRGIERFAMLCFAAASVHLALNYDFGAKFTDPIGDLSYGVYIFAFPVQQVVTHWGRKLDLSFLTLFGLSLLGTSALAYASWHIVERRALRFKPK